MKKPPSKVAHNRPRHFFFSTGLADQTAQKQKSRTTKSPLMQDWVFRLGLEQRRRGPRIGWMHPSFWDIKPAWARLISNFLRYNVYFGLPNNCTGPNRSKLSYQKYRYMFRSNPKPSQRRFWSNLCSLLTLKLWSFEFQ